MRVFFGLNIDTDTRRALADWRDRHGAAAGRAVPAANFHITLAFIGELENRQLDALCRAVDAWKPEPPAGAGEAFLDQVGYWPKPGIYWAGPSQPMPELAALARKLQHVGGLVGARLEKRPFTPHVTLYRGCTEPPPAPDVLPAIPVAYDHFTLFASQMGRQGVSYQALEHWLLGP
ncbi:RNA 2',3'-cyclic phosphodiesterase [Haliea sp.]